MELLAGAGKNHAKRMWVGDDREWSQLVTLDISGDHKPDVIWDLNVRPLPFAADTFDEVHAYEVCEHLGQHGDFRSFFAEWSEWWRILKPGGLFHGMSPHWSSKWCWMDPGHTRAYGPELLVFLVQPEYTHQVGASPMSDYRFVYKADFDIVHSKIDGSAFCFGLQAVKPSRIASSAAA
jgi:SAM-dependent methyltransferase